MGKSAGSPPPAPDPKMTIQAQSEANADTARLGARLNRVNQVGPTGTITYSEGAPPINRTQWENDEVAKARAEFAAANPPGTMAPPLQQPYSDAAGENSGGSGWTGATGPQTPYFDEAAFRKSLEGKAPPTVPGQDVWTQTTTLSPEQQKLYNLATGAQTTYGEIGNDLLNSLKGQLSTPVNVDWAAERDRALAAQMGRLNPSMAQAEEGLRSRLRNSGLTEGSEGWNREFNTFNQGRNDMMLAADLNAGNTVGQAIQQQAALRGMPLNEVAALLTGQQVQTPQLQNSPQAAVAPVDAMGAYNTQYQGQLAGWQADQQANNAALGGLFGLAGTLGGFGLRKFL